MLRIRILCVPVIGLLICVDAHAQAHDTASASSNLVRSLGSDLAADRQSAFSRLSRQQSSLVDGLLRIVDVEVRTPLIGNEQQCLAVRLLTEMQCQSAVAVLVRRIDNGPGIVAEQPLPLGAYPYALAIVEITDNADLPILRHLEATPPTAVSDSVIELYSATMLSIANRTGASSLPVVEEYLRRTHNRTNIERLARQLRASRMAEVR